MKQNIIFNILFFYNHNRYCMLSIERPERNTSLDFRKIIHLVNIYMCTQLFVKHINSFSLKIILSIIYKFILDFLKKA